MPKMQQITVKNGATPAVDVNYKPVATYPNTGRFAFATRGDGTVASEQRVDYTLRPPAAGQPTRKAGITLAIPKVHKVDGVEQVAYDDLAVVNLTTSKSATRAERRNLRVTLANLLLSPEGEQFFDDLEGFFG